MKNPRRILVPVDFSKHAEEALKLAVSIAEGMSMNLIVLHVVHDPAEAPGFYTPKGHKKSLKKIRELAAERLETFMTTFAEKYPLLRKTGRCEAKLVRGLPVTRILEVIEKTRPWMVIMGSEGRTGLANLMLGSKAEQLVRLAPVPVTIVKAKKHKDKK
ncbi:MAG: universal stress protein [Acidobacteriota bacterium]|nr:universal stress protein [Acidobacteriota bacterium]